MKNQEQSINAILRAHGHRLTRQRRLIMNIILESREHLDADTIFQRAKACNPKISLATVYRALATLKKEGLVNEHPLGEDHMHFETAQLTPHYHFTCKQCGRVIEFEAPQVLEIIATLRQTKGLQVENVHLLLSGTCDLCQK
jgi:Fe2+ or Zn2+ uptake regulation protein